MTFYSVYNIKIKNNYTWRIRFLFLALICLLFTVGAKCSTGAIATILIIISLFVPDKIKRVLKSPWIVMGSMVASALFPTFMTVIMNNSTGTPMDKLHGGAKRMAQMSNIGGGSKATGGGGVDEGMKAMLQYTWANTVKIRRLKPRMWLRSCWPAV